MIVVKVSEQVGQDLEQFVIGRRFAHLRAIYTIECLPIDSFGIEKGVLIVEGLPKVFERLFRIFRLWCRSLRLAYGTKAQPTLEQAYSQYSHEYLRNSIVHC